MPDPRPFWQVNSAHGGDPLCDPVAIQYERWRYPEPADDFDAKFRQWTQSASVDAKSVWTRYWPAAPYRDDLTILVAGCGTIAAACYASVHPRARVVGIDVSRASLEHENALKQRHGLVNLTLHHLPIEQVQSLDVEFDFIDAQGVLHHLADPVAGLHALGGVTHRNSVILIMLYGKYGRAGVYMLQELFQQLGLRQDPADLEVVKEAVSRLNPSHPARTYGRGATDLNNDAGLVDTFLHARDKAFAISDCTNLVRDAGLVIQGFGDMATYHPDLWMPPTSPFFQKLQRLQGVDLWQAMELFHGNISQHSFHVCRPDRDERTYRIHFSNEEFLHYVPELVGIAEPVDGSQVRLSRPSAPAVRLNDAQRAVFNRIDGRRSIQECVNTAGLAPGRDQQIEFARQFFGSTWRAGYMLYRMPPALAQAVSHQVHHIRR